MPSAALFAGLSDVPQGGGVSDLWPLLVIAAVFLFVIFFGFTALVLKCYKRCPSNRLLVIYGKTAPGRPAMCVHGGARLVLPLVQDYAWLSLESMQIGVPLQGALSADKIRINVPSVLTVAIGTSPELMEAAACRLLGLPLGEIEKQVSQIATGQLRQVIGSMNMDEIVYGRDKLVANIRSAVEGGLHKLGLELINVAVAEMTDESGYIEAVDQKVVANAVRDAKEAAAAAQQRAALEVDFGGSAQRMLADLLEQGKLSEEDRRAIRRLLEGSRSGEEA